MQSECGKPWDYLPEMHFTARLYFSFQIFTVNPGDACPVISEARSYSRSIQGTEGKNSAYFAPGLLFVMFIIGTGGFKEVSPLSPTGMWFTSFLIVVSFGIFVYAVTSVTRYMIDGGLRNYIEGDATQDEVLLEAGIMQARAMITTLPVDADNLYVVLTAKGLNPNLKIIARASNERSDVKLRRGGAGNVIMPDRVGGQRMEKLVIQPDVVEFIDFLMLQETYMPWMSVTGPVRML